MNGQLKLKFEQPERFTKAAAEKLSPREAQVIACLADGMTWKQTADTLKISIHTVRAYVEKIRFKLNVPNTPAAILILSR